jgi:hypothetical protein
MLLAIRRALSRVTLRVLCALFKFHCHKLIALDQRKEVHPSINIDRRTMRGN